MLLFNTYENEEEEVKTQTGGTKETKKNANLYGFSRQQSIQK